MHHLGVGATHARKRVLALADDHLLTIITDLAHSEILSNHLIVLCYFHSSRREIGSGRRVR